MNFVRLDITSDADTSSVDKLADFLCISLFTIRRWRPFHPNSPWQTSSQDGHCLHAQSHPLGELEGRSANPESHGGPHEQPGYGRRASESAALLSLTFQTTHLVCLRTSCVDQLGSCA